MTLPEDPATLLFWPAATIAFYIGARALNRIRPRWWSSPLLVTPALLILLATIMQAGYGDYNRGSHWLTIMVGPATVAFALPIWCHWRVERPRGDPRQLCKSVRFVLMEIVLPAVVLFLGVALSVLPAAGLVARAVLGVVPREQSRLVER